MSLAFCASGEIAALANQNSERTKHIHTSSRWFSHYNTIHYGRKKNKHTQGLHLHLMLLPSAQNGWPLLFSPAQKGTNVWRLNQIQIHCFALIFSTLCLHCTVNYLVFKHQLPCCANAVLKQMKFTCTDQMYWKRFCCFLNKQDWFTSWLTSYHRKEGNSLLDNISLPLNMFP